MGAPRRPVVLAVWDRKPEILPGRRALNGATAHREGPKPRREREQNDCSPRRREERQVKKAMTKTKEEIEQIAEQVVDTVLKVHRALGPGLLESTHQACLAHELRCRGIEVGCEVALPVLNTWDVNRL